MLTGLHRLGELLEKNGRPNAVRQLREVVRDHPVFKSVVKEMKMGRAADTIAAHSSGAARRALGSPVEPAPAEDAQEEKPGTMARELLRSLQIKG